MLSTAAKITAKKLSRCRSNELLFCFRENDQVSSTNMLFWEAANSKPSAYQVRGILFQEEGRSLFW